MPDHRGQNAVQGELSQKQVEVVLGSMKEFMRKHQQADERQKQKNISMLKQKKLANKHHMLALDHAMQGGLGVGLQSFMSDSPLRPLQANEERFMLPISEVPPHIAACTPGALFRSCIRNTETDDTRLEMRWLQDRHCLQAHLDMGSIGWPSKFYLYCGAGLRGWFWYDAHHRRNNDLGLAVEAAGLGFVRNEYGVVCNCGSAPFGRAGFFGEYSGAAKEFFSLPWDNELYTTAYPLICLDLHNGLLPDGFGSSEHMQQLWAELPELPCFRTKGDTVKRSRWFAHEHRVQQRMPQASAFMTVICMIGIRERWWKSIGSSPLGRALGMPQDSFVFKTLEC